MVVSVTEKMQSFYGYLIVFYQFQTSFQQCNNSACPYALQNQCDCTVPAFYSAIIDRLIKFWSDFAFTCTLLEACKFPTIDYITNDFNIP